MTLVGNESVVGFTQAGWPLLRLDLYTVQLGCGLRLITLLQLHRAVNPLWHCLT